MDYREECQNLFDENESLRAKLAALQSQLTEAKAQVLNDYRNDQVTRVAARYQDFLRRRANVLVAEDLR